MAYRKRPEQPGTWIPILARIARKRRIRRQRWYHQVWVRVG